MLLNKSYQNIPDTASCQMLERRSVQSKSKAFFIVMSQNSDYSDLKLPKTKLYKAVLVVFYVHHPDIT